MARLADRLPENVPGEFYVDRSCIDCDQCRQIAPASFARADAAGASYVHRQPDSPEGERRALAALVTCPTSSIGTVSKLDVAPGVASFPEPIAGGVHFCGF